MQASKFGRTDCADYDGSLEACPNDQWTGLGSLIHGYITAHEVFWETDVRVTMQEGSCPIRKLFQLLFSC